MEKLIEKTILALKQITNRRYYRTERGFSAELYAYLKCQLYGSDLFPKEAILELEYQKSSLLHYEQTQRPDIIIHIPIESGITWDRRENNFAVYALKLNGRNTEAKSDFDKLDKMFESLNYRVGFFINICPNLSTYLNEYVGSYKERIHEVSITNEGGIVSIKHAFFKENEIEIIEYNAHQ